MTKNFGELIDQKLSELDALKQQMELVRQQFIQASAFFMARWFPAQARFQIESNAERTLSLEDNQLKELKEKVSALSNDAPDIAQRFLSDSKLWWHIEESENHYYDYNGNRPPDLIDKPVRLALGTLASVLEEYGYLKAQTSSRGDLDSWREWDKSGNYKLAGGRPYYPQAVDWSPEMKGAMASYDQKMKDAMRIRKGIKELESEKKKAEASKRWDSL